MELKQIAKTVGFSRIKSEAKQHICLETPMEEPAWKLMSEKLPKHLQSRFVYQGKKVIVRGLGVLPVSKQMDDLIEWLGHLQGALPNSTDHYDRSLNTPERSLSNGDLGTSPSNPPE
jgi:transcription-repair coupling factor (superfamily II helicase)